MTGANEWRPATVLAQALGWIDEATGGLAPGIQPSSTFLRDADNRYRRGFSYGRDSNPTYRQTEAVLTALEGAAGGLLFASGMAAATAVFQALRPGDHVLAPTVMYWGLRKWLAGEARAWGLLVDFVPNGDLAALAAALRPGQTRIVWLETPANPTWEIADIAASAGLAHRAGALLAVDNTVPTPLITRPIELGADLVMHAATKYLNGHSDLIAGVLLAARADAFWQRVLAIRHDAGAILGSFEAWLLLRGLRTLAVRVERQCRTAERLAEHFCGHPGILQVLYAGLPTHPGHAVARQQMQGGFGGMLSLRIAGGERAAIAAAGRLNLWKRATSLGGVESLVEHRASIEGPGTACPTDLLRLSVGLEAAEDLIADLEQALGCV